MILNPAQIDKVPFQYKGGACSSSRGGTKILYIVWHYTANTSPSADALMHDLYYRNCKNGVSAHYTIDDKRIVQSVGDSRAAWAIGNSISGKINVGLPDEKSGHVTNLNTINLELCVNKGSNWNRTKAIALELTKNLMKRFGIPANHVIRHYDAQRYTSSTKKTWRKSCPGNMANGNWAEWREIKTELNKPIYVKWDLEKSSIGTYLDPNKSTSKLNEVESKEVKGTPILGNPTTTIQAMQNWAKSKNADGLFVDLAKTFYDVAVKYKIDPAVVYAQSAKETGFMRFGGVLDKSFCNPCGLKTTQGGGNYDKKAHQRFRNWEEGITAQVQHLGIYAGEIYKQDEVVDPRHFPEIRGTARTVEQLGGKWAPSASYGQEIVAMMKQFANTVPTTVKKDVIDLQDYKVVISLLSEADIEAGRELARAFNAAITFSGDIEYYPLKKQGKKIIAVGGNKANHTSYLDVIISGKNRKETLEKVKAYIEDKKKGK